MLKLITKTAAGTDEATAITATLDDLARVGAQRMIAAALQIEVDDYLARFRDERDAAGHARVVRNGTARARPVLTGVGPLTIAAPRVNDRRVLDGVRQKFTSRLEEERLCALVLIGVRPDGTKEVVALEDGYRESAESWRTVLRDLKRRGLRAPVLAMGDGALGFWAAVREVWPETAEQRCWVHRLANVLDKLPKSLQPRAHQALHEIMYAETRAAAEREIGRFAREYGAKYPKAVASLTVDQDRLLAYFDYPAEHWKHLRTTNPIESTFATVRAREGVTKGAGSRTAGLVMAFKLLQVAEGHWRSVDAAELVPLVRAGVHFEDGVQIEPQKKRGKKAAA